MDETPKNMREPIGPFFGIVIVIILLALGGLYFLLKVV